MNIQIVKIAPKMAEEWLSTSVGNPRWPSGKKLIDRRRVNAIAADIIAGSWNPGNNSIAFDEYGHLIDGHHRLAAIKQAGKTVESIVVFGVKEEAKRQVDAQLARRMCDRLRVPLFVTSAANIYYRLIHGIPARNITTEQVKDLLDQHPYIFTAAEIVDHGQKSLGRNGSVICAIALALEKHVISEDGACEFVRILNNGFAENESQYSAIVLRNMLLRAKINNISQRDKLCAFAECAIVDFANKVHRTKSYKRPYHKIFLMD